MKLKNLFSFSSFGKTDAEISLHIIKTSEELKSLGENDSRDVLRFVAEKLKSDVARNKLAKNIQKFSDDAAEQCDLASAIIECVSVQPLIKLFREKGDIDGKYGDARGMLDFEMFLRMYQHTLSSVSNAAQHTATDEGSKELAEFVLRHLSNGVNYMANLKKAPMRATLAKAKAEAGAKAKAKADAEAKTKAEEKAE